MRFLTHPLVALILLAAVVGCSANSEPASNADPTLPAQRATASQTEVVPSTATVADRAKPAVVPTITPMPTPVHTPADSQEAVDPATTYLVQAGDTLWGIAIAHGVGLEDLLAANALPDANVIWAGQELVIPNAGASEPLPLPPAVQATPPQTNLAPEDLSTLRSIRGKPTPTVNVQPLQNRVLLEPMLHDWQKMNNCAPTTVAMALSFYELLLTQFDTAPDLKGGPQDKNVSPAEIAAYLRDLGFGGVVRVNGDIETLQRLVSNGIPVIVEQWLDRPDDELTGHYRVVRGYDNTTQELIVNDSYSGPRLRFSHAEFDRLWRPFNRAYIPVYQPSMEPIVRSILGNNWNDLLMYEHAAEIAQAEIDALGDAYAWFNLGNSLLGLGEYERAATAYGQAIEIGLPPRMFWYQFGAFEAFNRTGQFQRALELSTPLTGLALEELHYQRGVAHEGLGQYSAALDEYRRAAEFNPRLTKAMEAVARLNDTDGS